LFGRPAPPGGAGSQLLERQCRTNSLSQFLDF
jgi:hypothetical protein